MNPPPEYKIQYDVGSVNIKDPNLDRRPGPAEPDQDPYPFQPKLNNTFSPRKFQYTGTVPIPYLTVQNIENYNTFDADEKDKTE
jgi:hypothetical protein